MCEVCYERRGNKKRYLAVEIEGVEIKEQTLDIFDRYRRANGSKRPIHSSGVSGISGSSFLESDFSEIRSTKKSTLPAKADVFSGHVLAVGIKRSA